MTNGLIRRDITTLAAMLATTLAFIGGCTSADAVGVDSFARDLLLNAAAAFLL